MIKCLQIHAGPHALEGLTVIDLDTLLNGAAKSGEAPKQLAWRGGELGVAREATPALALKGTGETSVDQHPKKPTRLC